MNVGGINIKMAELKAALAAAGFEDVRTLLASGNVVLTIDDGPAAVKQKFEKCLGDTFGYDAWVVVLTAQRVAELVEACPYPEDDKTTHTYITLASDTARLDELDAAGAALDGTDQTRLGPEALAWLAPVGGTLDSPFSKASAKPKFKASTTTRNLRTLIKVRDAAAAVA
ncbi:MAG: DUF1697 domain-containing protein [Cellulosimicrobium cellulans]